MKRVLEEELKAWKDKDEHLPILLRGARQVGKSYLIEQFGKTYFDDISVVDFERHPEFISAFHVREPKEIITRLEFILNKPIKEKKTLLFLDEVQLCPEALHALRYFKERMPHLHIIAAGSLLEFVLNDKNFSFPVGRIEFLYLRPFSFYEYLYEAAPFIANKLLNYDLENFPGSIEHRELMKWVRRYLFIGGMPAAIESSRVEESLLESQRVHYRILQAYESDFGKYAKHVQHKYLRLIFQKAPILIAKIFKFSHLDSEIRSRELKEPLDLLCHAGILQKIYATSASGLPLHAHRKDNRFKLLYLDVGLLQTITKVDASLFFNEEIIQINSGIIAEQFAGQELLAYSFPFQNESLLFWERDQGSAEIDYLIQVGANIVPVEVKAGSSGTLRSLHLFLKEKNLPLGVRISEQPLSLYDNILSVPFYLIGNLKKIINQALEKKKYPS